MRVVAAAAEDDMLVAFLRAELGSLRFAGDVLAALAGEGVDRPDDPARREMGRMEGSDYAPWSS